jgi:hypothetical protein
MHRSVNLKCGEKMWELACLRKRWISRHICHRKTAIAGKPAPTVGPRSGVYCRWLYRVMHRSVNLKCGEKMWERACLRKRWISRHICHRKTAIAGKPAPKVGPRSGVYCRWLYRVMHRSVNLKCGEKMWERACLRKRWISRHICHCKTAIAGKPAPTVGPRSGVYRRWLYRLMHRSVNLKCGEKMWELACLRKRWISRYIRH